MPLKVKEKCRACLNESSQYSSVFDTKTYDEVAVSFSSIIQMCASVIEIKAEDEFPQNICNSCISDADNAFKFRMRCVLSNEILRATTINIKEELDDGANNPLIDDDGLAKSEYVDEDVEVQCVDHLCIKAESVPSSSDDENLQQLKVSLTRKRTLESTNKISNNLQSNEVNAEEFGCDFDDAKNNSTTDSEEENELYENASDEFSEDYKPRSRMTQRNYKRPGDRVYRFFTRTQTKRLKCDKCPKTFFKQATLDLHIERHGKPGFKCNVCGKNDFMTGGGLKEHLKINHKTNDVTKNPCNCDICNIDYVEIDAYIQHMKSVHRDEDKPVKPCPECGKLLRKHNWDKHLKIHYGERKFKCEHCPMTFLFINNFRKHQITHTGERKFQCDYCELRFKSKGNLMRHIEHVHVSTKPKRKRKITYRSPNAGPVTCYLCGFQDSKKEMVKHMKANHIAHYRANYRAQEYKCKFCSRAFTHKAQYKLHFLDHPVAERKILQEDQDNEDEKIKAIIAEKSAKQEMCICEHCGKSVVKKNIDKHKQSHIDPYPYSCEHCGKKFTNQHNKNVHEKLHEGIAPFVCEVCGRGFGFRQCYNEHMYTHYNEKPYACELCGYKFIYKSSLQSHMQAHIRGTAMKPKTEEDLVKRVKCLLCDRLFSTKGNMDKHIRKIHKVVGYMPGDPSTAFGPIATVSSSTTSMEPI